MNTQVETSVLRLTMPAKPEYLMFTRLVLTGLSRSVEIEPETLADLKLAVTEACSHSIRACASTDAQLGIAYEVTGASIEITVEVGEGREDAGAAVEVEDGDPELGLVIIEAVVDELVIDRSEDGLERISFRKQLEPSVL